MQGSSHPEGEKAADPGKYSVIINPVINLNLAVKTPEDEEGKPGQALWEMARAPFSSVLPLIREEGWIQFWLAFGVFFWLCVTFPLAFSPPAKKETYRMQRRAREKPSSFSPPSSLSF